MEEKHIYFISYNYKINFNTGLGSGVFTSDKKLDSAENYDYFTNFIEKENNFDKVVILFFKELKENEE